MDSLLNLCGRLADKHHSGLLMFQKIVFGELPQVYRPQVLAHREDFAAVRDQIETVVTFLEQNGSQTVDPLSGYCGRIGHKQVVVLLMLPMLSRAQAKDIDRAKTLRDREDFLLV